MFFQNLNYIAIVIAMIAGVAVGFIWYAPWAFGRIWMKEKGLTKESMAAKQGNRSMAPTFALMALSALIEAFILSALFNSLIVTSFGGILLVALCVWIGFAVPPKAGDYLFGGESLSLFLISVGQSLVAITVMAMIVGIWA